MAAIPLSYDKSTVTEPPCSNIVDFDDPKDTYNPINWSFPKKVYISLLYGLTSFASVWASTAYAPANTKISERFDVDPQIALLGTSFLLLGWSFGPLLWAPLTELYGRKWPILIPFLVCTVMSFGTAAAKDIQTVLITRFFAGFFGSAPIISTGGVYADLWHPTERGNAIVGYTFCVCGGPVFGPVVGGAIIYYGTDWRWTQYITGIIQATVFLFGIIFIEESYVPTLLSRKAAQLRKSTGNWALHAEWEEKDGKIRELAIRFGLRPLQLLATPICLSVTIYVSFIYAILYATLVSFPIIFQDTRGWNEFTGSLPYLGLLVGVILGAGVNYSNQKYYNRRYIANNCVPVPEARLPPMMVASVVLAGGLFILGWTSTPSVHWFATVFGVFMLGFGYYTIFTCGINYLIDSFHRWSASALAANTFARSILAAVLPLLIPAMYRRLGNGWAFSVLGVIAVLNIPMPFVFWFYGPRIRKMGKYTANLG